MLDLTTDQVIDAETVGVTFLPATPQQIQRLSMQRKVFRVGGEQVVATRDGALFETAGTLERLIAEGERQRRDLAEWTAAWSAEGGPAGAVAAGTVPQAEIPANAAPVDEPPSRPQPLPAAASGPSRRKAAAARGAPAGERWLTAGAERRGRLAEHWSARRRR